MIEGRLRSPLIVAVTLAVGGAGLVLAERFGRRTRDARSLGYGEAFAIGCAQALALIPGISRSGATLTLAMFLNVERASAARFAFLMSLPAIVAAAAKEAMDLSKVGLAGLPITLLAVGLVVSAVVGYITVKFFVRYLAAHSLEGFAYYRFALAAITVLWLLAR